MPDLNDLAYWFPPIEAAGLPVPETMIVDGPDGDLVGLLDGERPRGFDEFLARLEVAVTQIGTPCFLRTGHTSGKHHWNRCCDLRKLEDLPQHVAALVEESHMTIPSLPTDTWVVRQLLPTDPMFYCDAYGEMPFVREFRFFVRDGKVEHTQPYWPADSLEQGDPGHDEWRFLHGWSSSFARGEEELLTMLAERAGAALGGYWSVDFMQVADGGFYLIDMAEGDRSFRYDPEQETSAA